MFPVYIDSNRNDTYEERRTAHGDGRRRLVCVSRSHARGVYRPRRQYWHRQHSYPQTGGGILWPTGVSHPAVGNVTPTSITNVARQWPGVQSNHLAHAAWLRWTHEPRRRLPAIRRHGIFTSNSPIVRSAFPTIISTLQSSLPGLDLGFGSSLRGIRELRCEVATGRPFILNQPIVASSTTASRPRFKAHLTAWRRASAVTDLKTDIEALYQLVTGAGFDGNNNGSVLDSGAAAGLVRLS